MLDRFRHAVGRVFDQNVYSTRLSAFYAPLLGFLPSLGLAVILLVGGREVINGGLSLGNFTAFYTYLLMLIAPMRILGTALGMAQRAVASGNRMFEILDREPQDRERAGRAAASGRPGPSGAAERRTHLPRRSRASRRRPRREAGGTVAVVGPSGSGKTSLVALLARLYDPTEGSVRDRRRRPARGGARARSAPTSRSSPTTASCSPPRSLRTSPTRSPAAGGEDIERAARRAQAHGFITRLPDGYDTVIGERGLTLSGGQRQRIAIARALVANPRILVLDDATSSVDARTEAAIRRGLAEVMAGRTTFIVAHRLSTISLADEIVVIDAGEIVDRGTHEELLERCPLYAEIADHGTEDSVYLQRDLEERAEVARL